MKRNLKNKVEGRVLKQTLVTVNGSKPIFSFENRVVETAKPTLVIFELMTSKYHGSLYTHSMVK